MWSSPPGGATLPPATHRPPLPATIRKSKGEGESIVQEKYIYSVMIWLRLKRI
ncbi:MAG: hypothetical protein ACTSRL_03195 [Candidatus Helarchaeota archaeon]